MQEPTRWVGWEEALASVAHDLESLALSLVDGIEGAALQFANEMGREIGAAGALAAKAGLLAAREIRRERRVLWTHSVKAGRLVAKQSRQASWKVKAIASALAFALSTVAWQTHAQKAFAKDASRASVSSVLGERGLLSPQESWASADAVQATAQAGALSGLKTASVAAPLASQWIGGAAPSGRALGSGLNAQPLSGDVFGARAVKVAAWTSSGLAEALGAPSSYAPQSAGAAPLANDSPLGERVAGSFSGGSLTMLAAPSSGMGLREPADDHAAMKALSVRLASDFKADPAQVAAWTQEASKQAKARGIEPTLALAVIAIESRFQARARSKMGAVGLMQVILHYHPEAVKQVGGAQNAAAPMGNIAVGLSVLDQVRKMSEKRGGGWPLALSYYNGSANDPRRSYANKVLKEKARIEAMLQVEKSRLANAQGGPGSQYAQANERT